MALKGVERQVFNTSVQRHLLNGNSGLIQSQNRSGMPLSAAERPNGSSATRFPALSFPFQPNQKLPSQALSSRLLFLKFRPFPRLFTPFIHL
jgi:hypothetical protein